MHMMGATRLYVDVALMQVRTVHLNENNNSLHGDVAPHLQIASAHTCTFCRSAQRRGHLAQPAQPSGRCTSIARFVARVLHVAWVDYKQSGASCTFCGCDTLARPGGCVATGRFGRSANNQELA